ncbi:MAG: GAF domain-containing protein [Chloroflexi bacterium]|nr:GAF domain-containing protein [Chloroflexota bacterium]
MISKPTTFGLTEFWNWLTAPQADVTDIEERRRAQLFSSLIVLTGVTAVISTATTMITSQTAEQALGFAAIILAWLIPLYFAYRLSRTKHHRTVAIVFIVVATVATLLTNIINPTGDGPFWLVFLVVFALYTSILFSISAGLIYAIGVSALVALVWLTGLSGFSAITGLNLAQIVLGYLIVVLNILLTGKVRESDLRQIREHAQRLKTSEEDLRFITDTVPDLVIRCEVGEHFRIRYVSSAVEQQLGFAPDEMIGRAFGETIHQDDRAAVLATLRQFVVHPSDSSINVTYRQSHRDGSFKWSEARGQISRNPHDPDHPEFIAVIRDVSRRTSLENRLKRHNELLETLNELSGTTLDELTANPLLGTVTRIIGESLNATSAYINHSDPAGITSTVIAEYLSAEASPAERVSDLGQRYEIGDFYGDGHNRSPGSYQIIQWDDPQISDHTRQHLAQHGGKTYLDVPLFVQDQLIGSIEIWESRQKRSFTPDEIDLVRAIASQVANIVHRSRLQTNVGQRAHQMEALAKVAQAVNATLDLDEVLNLTLAQLESVIRYDSAAIHLIEADGDQIRLTAARGFDDNDSLVGTIMPLDGSNLAVTALHEGRPVVVPDVQKHPNWGHNMGIEGASTIRSWIGAPLITTGRRVGVLTIDSHTPGFFTEEEATIAGAFAEQVATALRNARLYQDSLEYAKAAEEASQAKSLFLANVSHELRTPLTSVLGFTQITKKRLEQRILPAIAANSDQSTQRAINQVRHYTDIIINESHRLTALINDVLDLEKIAAGKLVWQMAPLDINQVVSQSVEATAGLFDSQAISLRTNLAADLPPLIGDYNRLMQVMVNLISNAVKFTDEGSITIRTHLRDGVIEVRVIDTGIGISAEDHEVIFEKFRQVGDSLIEKPAGTGLGLPITKEIIEYHQGRIWVESSLGQGSTFVFELPLTVEQRESSTLPTAKES